MLPSEYKIGDIIINGYGTVTSCRVLGYAKVILLTNDYMMEDGASSALRSDGYFT